MHQVCLEFVLGSSVPSCRIYHLHQPLRGRETHLPKLQASRSSICAEQSFQLSAAPCINNEICSVEKEGVLDLCMELT